MIRFSISISQKTLAILFFYSFLTACGSNSSDNHTPNTQEYNLSDNAAKKDIYHKIITDKRFPGSFYQEPERNNNMFYTIKHISNHDLSLYDVHFSYPLCEDSFSDALEKSNQEGIGKNLVDNTDNNWYYEFSRQSSNNVNTIYIQRIYKCDTYNVGILNDYKGQYNTPNIEANSYQSFIEYQWYFSFNNNYGNIVLSSDVFVDNSGITKAVIVNAKIVSFDECNEIHIIENHYDIDTASRKINRYNIVTDIFYAKVDNNIVEICS